MPKPYASAVLPAYADELWAYLRDFSNIADWHPNIVSGELEEGTGDGVGCIRRLRGPGGETLRERLVALDDAERSCTYEFVESPFPIRRYRSTLRVAPVTDSGQAFAEWWAWFDCDAKDEESLTRIFGQAVYGAGLGALQERFS